MHDMQPQLCQQNHYLPAQSGTEHGLLKFQRGQLSNIVYWTIRILYIYYRL